MSAVAMTDFICPLYNWLRGEQMTERFKTILSKALGGFFINIIGGNILYFEINSIKTENKHL